MSLVKKTGLLLLMTLAVPGLALAQTSMGGVSGTVTDSTGAVVPGATVTLVNEATNVQGERQTNDNGPLHVRERAAGQVRAHGRARRLQQGQGLRPSRWASTRRWRATSPSPSAT